MNGWLYRMEVRGIQRWILASDRLRELKGGSAVIELLAEESARLAEALGGRVLVEAAGGVTVLFPDGAGLAAFARHAPMLVARRAPGLTCVQAWAAGDRADRLFEILDVSPPPPPVDLPEAGPLLARAGRTGLPAARRGTDGDEDRATRAKVDASRADPLGERLLGDKVGKWAFIEDAEDFGDGHVAVIHADGNGIGRIVRSLAGAPERLAAFSGHLKAATGAAAMAAVAALIRQVENDEDDGRETKRDNDGRRLLLARPIVLGGDDLSFIVHGRYALPFADLYLRRFEQETRDRSRGGPELEHLTACAGIAFVKPGWPFHAAHALAESLCRAAKGMLGRQPSGPPSGVLFHRVTTALSDLDWKDIVERELSVPPPARKPEDPPPPTLTAGPYDLRRLSLLDALAGAAGRLPRGALQGWLAETRASVMRADARWKRLAEVGRTGAGQAAPAVWQAFSRALDEIGVDPQTGWASGAGDTTPIGDALAWRALQPGVGTRLWSNDVR